MTTIKKTVLQVVNAKFKNEKGIHGMLLKSDKVDYGYQNLRDIQKIYEESTSVQNVVSKYIAKEYRVHLEMITQWNVENLFS